MSNRIVSTKQEGTRNFSWEGDTPDKPFLSEKQKDSVYLLSRLSAGDEHDDCLSAAEMIAAGASQNVICHPGKLHSWIDQVEEELQTEEEGDHRNHLAHLYSHKTQCEGIQEVLAEALNVLDDIYDQYDNVSSKTNALHEACDHLMGSQNKMMERVKILEESLKIFTGISNLESKVNSPLFEIAAENLMNIFNKVASYQQYLSSHLTYKETPTYQKRLNSCLQRCLTLTSEDINQNLEKVVKKIHEDMINASSDNAFSLLYGKFSSSSAKVRPIMALIEDQIDANPLYRETCFACYNNYLNKREQLLSPVVKNSVTDIMSKYNRDHSTLLRSGCALLSRLCADELSLFNQFFTRFTDYLNDMLRGLMQHFEDVFRPLLIHIQHLETLAELCSILRVEMIEEHVNNSVLDMSVFSELCHDILADVQERIVYRTDVYIRTQILGFTPSPGDLSYPQKLEMMMAIAEELRQSGKQSTYYEPMSLASASGKEITELPLSPSTSNDAIGKEIDTKNDNTTNVSENTSEFAATPMRDISHQQLVIPADATNTNMPLSPADLHGMWYPTVRRALSCLSKLYRCLDPETFQGLAQECVSQCVQSLLSSSQKISSQSNSSQVDGFLFLIKHLLILREQLTPFNVEFTIKETSIDFRKYKDAAYEIWTARSRLLSLDKTNVLLQFLLERPQVIETVVDSRRQLDGELKRSCEDFIGYCVTKLSGSLTTFGSELQTRSKRAVSGGAASPTGPPAEEVREIVATAYKTISKESTQLRHSLHLYLANAGTERILLRPIRIQVLKAFREFSVLLEEIYSEEDRHIIALPSEEQITLLLQTSP